MDAVLQASELSLPPRLRALSLSLHCGETVGLLGINGAGKSTVLQALAGALPGVRGTIRLHGEELAGTPRLRDHIGWLPQSPPLYPDLSVRENLAFFAGLHTATRKGQSHIDRALQHFALTDLQKRLAHRLSGGERMRLALAATLIHKPDILLLDEPSAGLDPLQAERLRELIRVECAERTVLLASHLLPDIQQLCDRVLLLHEGSLVADEAAAPEATIRCGFLQAPPDEVLAALPGVDRVIRQEANERLLQLTPQAPGNLAEQVAAQGWGLTHWHREPNDLLQRFRALSAGELQ